MDSAKKILLIEDDQYINEIYSRQITQAGYQLTSVMKGDAANKEIQNQRFDLILLDVMLPDTNGIELLKTIKSSDQNQQTSVVLLTNLAQEEVIQQAKNLGAVGYLVKAMYNPDQIMEQIANVLSGKGIVDIEQTHS